MRQIDRVPMVPGSDPMSEPKLHPNGSINARAVMIERVHLYDGQPRGIVIDAQPYRVRGFMDIQTGRFADRERVYSTFAHWGLVDVLSRKEFGGYSTGVDPLHIFRTVKTLEALPSQVTDWSSIHLAVVGVFSHKKYEKMGPLEYRTERSGRLVEARKRILQLIGEEKLTEIAEAIPPDLEDIVAELRRGQNIWVDYATIRDEARNGRLLLSEFFFEGMEKSEQQVRDIAEGLREAGGAW